MNQQQPLSADDFVLEEFIPYKLALVSRRLSQAISREIEKHHSTSIAEWRIMATLRQYQPCAARFMVDRTGLDPARISRAQKRLLQKKLIHAETDKSDRRRASLSLTAEGQALIEAIIPEAWRLAEEILGTLSPSEYQSLQNSLTGIGRRLADMRRPDSS